MHELDKVLYCQTCSTALCPLCFIDHKDHEFFNLKKVYEEKKALILTALEPIEKQILEIDKKDVAIKDEI